MTDVRPVRGFFGSFNFDSTGAVVNNPGATFTYTITAAAIAANRVLNLPLLTGDDTFAVLGLAQTFSADQTFGNLYATTSIYGSSSANGNLVLSSTSNATKGNITTDSVLIPTTTNAIDLGSSTKLFQYIYAQKGLQFGANQYFAQISPTSNSGLYFDNVAPKNISIDIGGVKKHIFYAGASAQEGAHSHATRTSDPSGTAVAVGSFYTFDTGSSDYWQKVFSNSVWVDQEQKETITVTPGATVTLTHHQFTNVYAKWTAGEAETVNASGTQKAGQRMNLLILNDATLGRTITFGTGFKPSATVVGTISKVASISFLSDGTNWYELSRTLLL